MVMRVTREGLVVAFITSDCELAFYWLKPRNCLSAATAPASAVGRLSIHLVTKKTEVPVTSSSLSSDMASKFLKFLDIPQANVEIFSPLDVHVHHEVLKTQAPTLLTILVSVITESSLVLTNIPQSSQTFTPPSILTTPTPPLTIETTNPLSTLPDFTSVFRFNDRITTLEKEVAKL
ncbi:hypothetical protein Tco_1154633 [Tanacetum coccineum]